MSERCSSSREGTGGDKCRERNTRSPCLCLRRRCAVQPLRGNAAAVEYNTRASARLFSIVHFLCLLRSRAVCEVVCDSFN